MGNPNHDAAGRFSSGRGSGGTRVAIATATGRHGKAVAKVGGGQHLAATGGRMPFGRRHPVLSAGWKVAKVTAKINQAPKALVLAGFSGVGLAEGVGDLAVAAAGRKVATRAAASAVRNAAEPSVARAALRARGGSIPYASKSKRGVYTVRSF